MPNWLTVTLTACLCLTVLCMVVLVAEDVYGSTFRPRGDCAPHVRTDA